ncbi:MAG: integrase, partial [Rhizobiales bacterium 17-65-6]
MARIARNSKTDSRSARAKLAARREPYWTKVSEGCFLGYRKGAKGGTWIARFRSEAGSQAYDSLGAADDFRDADGLSVFSFDQAQAQARDWFDQKAREQAGLLVALDAPYTVSDALRDYFAYRENKGSKGVYADRKAAEARIIPALGDVELAKLTVKKLRDWHHGVASSAKLVRVQSGKARKIKVLDRSDSDAVRARRATANRQLTILKASLNHAY